STKKAADPAFQGSLSAASSPRYEGGGFYFARLNLGSGINCKCWQRPRLPQLEASDPIVLDGSLLFFCLIRCRGDCRKVPDLCYDSKGQTKILSIPTGEMQEVSIT
ncbi:hypothetical protein, partial [Laceyella tengchongensis]|uniref:hypothetical protein n=1 Tax=Laceyella tengchongensis TaxID=574699 RepID=UPI001E42807B